MATLKELMINRTRGDGTKVRILEWDNSAWFEPIYKSHDRWYGIMYDSRPNSFYDFEDCWEEWTLPKEKKKVKMYRYIAKNVYEDYSLGSWSSNKCSHPDCIGWQEMEIEVDE